MDRALLKLSIKFHNFLDIMDVDILLNYLFFTEPRVNEGKRAKTGVGASRSMPCFFFRSSCMFF